ELKRETDLIDSRARHYLSLKDNLSSGLRFAEAEFSIPRGLLKAILDRTMVLEGYTALPKDIPEIRNINQKCNIILDRIKAQMPE
ncbi:YiiX/YebB-like N1pC/P60 family cysteine hydrolase, partial [Pantoea allii]